MALTLPYPSLTTNPATKAEVEGNFTAISAKLGGNLVNADISASAAISVSKLDKSYEYMNVKLYSADVTVTPGILDYLPLYNDGKGSWSVVGVQYLMDDAGTTGPTFQVLFGYPTDASTTFNTTTTVTAATAVTASNGNYRHASVTVTGATVAPSANNEGLALKTTVAGVATGPLHVGVMLKRQIAA